MTTYDATGPASRGGRATTGPVANENLLQRGDAVAANVDDPQLALTAFDDDAYPPSTSTDVRPFDFHGTRVRVVQVADESWFVASDVGAILGLANISSSLALLDDDERGLHSMETPSGVQPMAIVSESGLYSLTLRSRRAEAKAFRRWVTGEVLPSIRRTGRFEVTPAVPAPHGSVDLDRIDPRDYALMILRAVEQRDTARAQLEAAQPAIEAHHAFMGIDDRDMALREAAQYLHRGGIDTGQNRLARALRELGWVDGRGKPYQQHVDARWITTRPQIYAHPHTGEPIFGRPQIRITPRGLDRLRRVLGGDDAGQSVAQ